MTLTQEKTIVFGIDSACWEYLDPLLKAGRLPNLHELMRTGTYGVLKSTTPPLSPLAWSTFLTGRNPENHGVLDWWHAEDHRRRFRPANALDRQCEHIWDYLNAAGIKIGIQNIPLTYPAQEVDGYFISGFDSPESGRHGVFPESVREEVKRIFNAPFPLLPSFSMIHEGDLERFKRQYFQYNELQTELALTLLRKFDIDLLTINYMSLDHFSHKMKNYHDVEEALERIDGNLGQFIKKYPDANFIVISDHGSVRTKGAFLILDWLEDERYLAFKNLSKKLLCSNSIMARVFQESFKWNGIVEKALRNTFKYLMALLPGTLWEKTSGALDRKSEVLVYCSPELVDLNRSKISFCSAGLCGFYMNSRLSKDERERVCGEMVQKLRALKAPETGSPLFERVERSDGASLDSPDILAWGNHEFHMSSSCRAARRKGGPYCYTGDTGYYGAHTENGIYIFRGKVFHAKGLARPLNLTDIPATILALQGVSVPADLDGKPAWHVFAAPVNKTIQPSRKGPHRTSSETLTHKEQEEVKQKLKSLGYL